MTNSIATFIERFRWHIILMGILFALFGYSEKSKLGVTDDYRMFFSKDNHSPVRLTSIISVKFFRVGDYLAMRKESQGSDYGY